MQPPATVLTQLEIPLQDRPARHAGGRAAGCTTILNPARHRTFTGGPVQRGGDHANETERGSAWGWVPPSAPTRRDLGRRLLERGCGAALLTLGERGCLCVTADGSEHVPGFAVSQVVDTTGAGDAFNAGLAVALAEGRPLAEAARFANAAAALCCTALATLPSYHTRQQVETFIGGSQ